MKIKFFCLFYLISFIGFTLEKEQSFCDYEKGALKSSPWYGYIQSGYAYSFKASIYNPDSTFWDNAIEGYNNNLGGSPYFSLGFGRSFLYYLRADMAYTYFQGFHYQKSQTGFSSTIGFTGVKRIRYFDLDHQNVMFNLSLYPEKHFYCSFAKLDLSAFIGFGIGAGFHRVLNFHTVAYSLGVGSSSSIGLKSNNSSFAWQGFTGIRLHPTLSCMSMDLAYRYYHGGSFECPSKIYAFTQDLQGNSVSAKPWKGKLRTNQFVISLNYWF